MLAFPPTSNAAQDTQALREVWSGLHAHSCPWHYNFHLHTLYSDGRLTPVALIEQAIYLGLQGLAITDHHCVQGFYLAQSYLEQIRRNSPTQKLPHLWTGTEITALLAGVEVHLLAYGFIPHHPQLLPYLSGESPKGTLAEASQVVHALKSAGALVVLAHPHRYPRPAAEVIPAAAALEIDGLEAYYAYGNPKPWQPSALETTVTLEFCQAYHLLPTCGTDTHGLDLLVRI